MQALQEPRLVTSREWWDRGLQQRNCRRVCKQPSCSSSRPRGRQGESKVPTRPLSRGQPLSSPSLERGYSDRKESNWALGLEIRQSGESTVPHGARTSHLFVIGLLAGSVHLRDQQQTRKWMTFINSCRCRRVLFVGLCCRVNLRVCFECYVSVSSSG